MMSASVTEVSFNLDRMREDSGEDSLLRSAENAAAERRQPPRY